jgi:hypothetical protein
MHWNRHSSLYGNHSQNIWRFCRLLYDMTTSVDASDILDRSDIECARSPRRLLAWVNKKCEELGATPEAKAFARSGAPMPKKFYEEIRPLAIFAGREFADRDDVLVEPNLGNDNFDARINVGGDSRTIFVEITYAKDGYDESRRMEVLAREGSVCLTGPVFSSGRKGSPNRKVHVESEARSHAMALKKYLAMVKERLEEKARSCYGKDHVLLVAVDDYLTLQESSDHDCLRAEAQSWLLSLDLDFGRVVFLGVAGKLFISFELAG